MNIDSSTLTWRFDFALQFASGLHRQQLRKGTTIPYVSHLISVCALVLDAGGDEDQAIAALLHDAVEDQGGLATLSIIGRLFGDRVASVVESCSDSTESDPAKKTDWRGRKEKYLEHLQSASVVKFVSGCNQHRISAHPGPFYLFTVFRSSQKT